MQSYKCYRCQVVKPKTEFCRDRTKGRGLTGFCKACKRERDRLRWRQRRETNLARGLTASGLDPYYGSPAWKNVAGLAEGHCIDYAANQRRWAEKAVGVDFGGR